MAEPAVGLKRTLSGLHLWVIAVGLLGGVVTYWRAPGGSAQSDRMLQRPTRGR